MSLKTKARETRGTGRRVIRAILLVLVVALAGTTITAQELLTNGNFETGAFAPWVVTDLAGGTGTFYVDAPGTTTPESAFATAANPAGGAFYAVTDQNNPGTHALTQSFTVPAGSASVTLSFDMFVNDWSNLGPIVDPAGLDHNAVPNQHARVDLLTAAATSFDTAGGVVANFYLSVDPGADPNAYTNYSIDITPFVGAGGTFQIRFAETDNQGQINLGVDNVSILAVAVAPYPANAALGPATLAGYESCDISTSPAATLLLPYFEVDPSGAGENTVVAITNASDTAIVAHVTVWSNWSFPVLDFNLFLTGYDVVTMSLRDLLVSGNIPNTQRGAASPLGVRSRVGASTRIEAPYTTAALAATCAGAQGGNGAVPGFLRSQIQSGLTGGPYSAGGVACGQVGDVSENMIGYITFDTSAVCSQSLPTDATYFATEIRWENQLIGDYIRLNDVSGYAGGSPMVHIQALPGGNSTPVTTLPWTFYNRYQSGIGVIDRRQPLPALFAARYIEAGVSFDTDFVVWREGVTDQLGTLACNTVLPDNASFPYVEIVRFDERENPTTRQAGCQVSPCPPNIGLSETQLLNVNNSSYIPTDPSADAGGWVYFNLSIPEGDPLGWGRPSQNWVQIRMTGAGLYGVDFDAAYLGNGCQGHVGLTLLDGGTGSSAGGEKIGPKFEAGTLLGWIGN